MEADASTSPMQEWMDDWVDQRKDPASSAKGLPPNNGREVVPHVLSFQSWMGTVSRAYQNSDEAVLASLNNAHIMKRDLGIWECIEARKRLVANLDWEILPEDENCPFQMSVADKLTKILRRIKRLSHYFFTLQDAIWCGRSGVQNRYGKQNVDGMTVTMPTPLCADHLGWIHVQGDKLVFRQDLFDGHMPEGAYPHQMGVRIQNWKKMNDDLLRRELKAEPFYNGMAVFLKPHERETFVVHKHQPEDSAYEHTELAGSIHGVGIRSRIYYEWFLYSETKAFLMQYLERSAGGIEVWYYPQGDDKALEACKDAAAERQANGRNTVFFPRPLGEDGPMYDVQFIEPGMAGIDMMQRFIDDHWSSRFKRFILGQKLSSEADGTGLGSGVADAHMETLGQIIRFDARNLEQTITDELVRVIQKYNWPETLGWYFRFVFKTEDDKAKQKMESLVMLQQLGGKIPAREAYKAANISAPKPDDELLESPASGGDIFNGSEGPIKGMPEEISPPETRTDFSGPDPFRQERKVLPQVSG